MLRQLHNLNVTRKFELQTCVKMQCVLWYSKLNAGVSLYKQLRHVVA